MESATSPGSHLILKGAPVIRERGGPEGIEQKTIGETPPVRLDLDQIGGLVALFSRSGLLSRMRRKLNYLKNKKCIIVPAKGTTACVDDEDVVYIGVDFLEKYKGEEETIAGVLAHEWGHACALKPHKERLQKLNWNQIFALRRAHETLADETSGRLLYMMGYSPMGLINFLTSGKETHNLKYHAPEIRAQVIKYGFVAEKRKAKLARQIFKKSVYKNPYSSFLLDIA